MGSFPETYIGPLTGSKADSDHVHFSIFSDSALVFLESFLDKGAPNVNFRKVSFRKTI